MYKATASGQQFFAREAMHSTKGSRRGFDLLDHGANPASVLSIEEQRDSLRARLRAVESELQKYGKKTDERAELGKQKNLIQNEIHALRPKIKGSREIRDYFIDAARRRLPKAVYMAIMDDANEEWRRVQREIAEHGKPPAPAGEGRR